VAVVVGMREQGRVIHGDCGKRRLDVAHCPCQPIQLAVVELGEDTPHEIVSHDLHVGQNLPPPFADADEHDTSVLRVADAFDETAFLHAVDEAGRVRVGDVEELGDPAHRQLAMAVEHRHEMEVTHRDSVPDEALARDATQLAERRPKLRDDGVDDLQPVWSGDSSCHADYSTYADDAVNGEDWHEQEEPMRFALMIEPQQGLTYEEQRGIARAAEAAGFEALFRSDHYESFPGAADNPTTDAWAVLAGLARETSRIHLGTLVSPVTFRPPGNLAKVVATVDEMSGGRVEVGLGAGWHESEHRRHGFPFPPIGERADMLEEQLQILRGLWGEPDGWSFKGRHYTIEDAQFRRKPVPRPRILVGGGGTPRSMRLAARWADEFNLSSSSPDLAREKFAALDEVCRAAERDPASLTHSSMAGVLVGANAGELAKREKALIAALGGDAGDDWLDERRKRWVYGTPADARATIARFAEAGVERIMLQDFVPRDLDMIALLGRELVARG
jgi:F420-dependent oxidoreductase-like protein